MGIRNWGLVDWWIVDWEVNFSGRDMYSLLPREKGWGRGWELVDWRSVDWCLGQFCVMFFSTKQKTTI